MVAARTFVRMFSVRFFFFGDKAKKGKV